MNEAARRKHVEQAKRWQWRCTCGAIKPLDLRYGIDADHTPRCDKDNRLMFAGSKLAGDPRRSQPL